MGEIIVRKIYEPGTVYNSLTFIAEPLPRVSPRYGLFQCECGVIKRIKISNVVTGNTKSCSCKWLEAHTIHGDARIGKVSYLYKTWRSMLSRCYNPNNKKYHTYKNVEVFIDWQNDYVTFKEYILKHLGQRPEGMSLDRIKTKGNYEPGNIRWATINVQNRNREFTSN